ncbi:complement regulator-acquiring protein [Borreliella tanukii]|uniref:complement regulator-acquiring protein n=1 Tax=Borreliella tanukii TaxID=56146 RepID=UPI00264A19C3|nr:complement regulator-acquiring protein [Borreliella tanukii]WKC79427.1 complement regulator-acquiring protein [Borreliella tanukii]
MTKTKLNIIKLNIITAILTLIFISCASDNTVIPKPNNHTNSKENNQNFENESSKSEDLKPSNQKPKGTTASKLEIIANSLEAQKEKENIEIAKIDTAYFNFLGVFKADHYDELSEYEEIEIKRMIYSSLNYEKQKIATLKEILDKLNIIPEHKPVAKKFIYQISLSIQSQLSLDLILIKEAIRNNSHTLPQKESELLMQAESDLKLKQSFAKALSATLEAYNKNSGNIKNNLKALSDHMDENYKDLDSLKPIY